MKIKSHLILLCFFAIACSNNKQSTFTPKVKLLKTEESLNISQIVTDLKVLEIDSDIPIAGLPNILIGPTFLYLYDRDYSRTLYQVDFNGEIINKIRFGDDSRINISTITNIFLKDMEIGIVVNGLNVIWFDENLNELSTSELLVKGMFQLPYNEDYITFTNSANETYPWDIVVSNKKVKIKALPINQEKYKFVYKPKSPFSVWKNENILFSKQFNDTIYVYDGNKTVSHFSIIDFGEDRFPENEYLKIKNSRDMMQFFNQKKYTYLSGEIFVLSNEKILLEYIDRANRKIGIWSEGDDFITSYPSIKDDMISNIILYTPSAVKNNKIAFGVTGENMLENYNSLTSKFRSSLPDDYSTSYYIYLADLK